MRGHHTALLLHAAAVAGAAAMQPRAFEPVLLHEVTPHSWMLKQLRIQASGLSGVLDLYWPQVSESVWIGHSYPTFAGGERATYWLNGQLPLHHLLANADPASAEAQRTGEGVDKYMDYIIAHQDAGGWLGPGANDTSGALLWARYYLLYTFALRAESTANATRRAESIDVMLRHVHASARMMDAGNWHERGNGWGVWRVQEYLLVLQWLLENAPSDEHDFLQQHALKVRGRATFADWEGWFDKWNTSHCMKDPPPAPAPPGCKGPATGPLPPLPPPPPDYKLFKEGVFCCDQSPCTKDAAGHSHSTFLSASNLPMSACASKCGSTPGCKYITVSKPHGSRCGACFLSEYCNTTGAFVPFKGQPGDRGDTFEKTKATERYVDGRPLEAVMPAANPKPGHWPRCGMATHGVNTAQAIKTAAVLWRFDADPRLKRLNDERMGRIDEKYGVATGLFCADESLCAAPWDTEENRKSPSRGTELCSVVESMYSYNEMFSILGSVAHADRAERIALNALSATFVPQLPSFVSSKPQQKPLCTDFQATNQWRATNVSDSNHLYQDRQGNLESFFSGSDQGGCCTGNNGQGWPKYALRSVFRTVADGGIAVGVFVPLRVQLSPSSVLLVDTDYPYSDIVTVLMTNPAKATPLRIRVPTWATNATALLNGASVGGLLNGTMHKVLCASGQTCNLTLSLNPGLRLESLYGNSVSVLRGPLLFSADIGRVVEKYDGCAPIGSGRGCGDAPYQPKAAQDMQKHTPAGWLGVSNATAANLALVIPDRSDLDAAFALSSPGLRCSVRPAAARWPGCALSTPPSCERSCVAPFNHSGTPMYLTAKARLVHNWTFVRPGFLEAAPPPRSPACAAPGSCGPTIDVRLVPHGSTNVRVGSLPVA